jgi:IS5 family transposase
VQCINKDKSRNRLEFGAKAGIALTYRSTLIVDARAFASTPFDGNTLTGQLELATILMQDIGATPRMVYTDLGYRDADHDTPQIDIRHRSKKKTLGEIGLKLLKRR